MKHRRSLHTHVGMIVLALAGLAASAQSQAGAPQVTVTNAPASRHALGGFDIKMTPLRSEEMAGGDAIGRYAIDKQYHGDMEGAGKGEMLGAGDRSKGSAGYVAIESFTGTLQGRKGSFALQHFGAMDHGKLSLTVNVVPGSGTGEMAGISGSMTITQASGKHTYQLDYTLPAPP